ncbi:10100_t:CDS:2 [Entrophospora sp. SA101]|nr:10100_t:CDS:2 [Entrophospora sp. SA101]
MASIIQPTNDWVKKLSEVKIDKSDLNKLIMNYFVIEGYKDAAETFSQECGISPSIDVDSINDRMNIKNAIQNGNVEEAIERVNDLNPEASILDTNPKLYFHLQQQRLIEYIRQGRVSEALEFAQDELAPLGEENPEFLEELERSMALLAFDDTTTSPVGDLLHPSQRLRTASELNAAILTSQSQEKDPKLPNLLKMLVWAQDELDEKKNLKNLEELKSKLAQIVDSEDAVLTSLILDFFHMNFRCEINHLSMPLRERDYTSIIILSLMTDLLEEFGNMFEVFGLLFLSHL